MDELYARVSSTAKQALYQSMKDKKISILNYHFVHYFQSCIQENHIKVIPHHFSSYKIEGLTVVDELGISFSYERDNPKVKQNFTLCHELGHFILNHEGSYFAESVDNQEDILEREANIFSAVVLMPDIVLLSKIYYSCDTFKRVQDSLEVSKQAFYFRLLDLLREHFPDRKNDIKGAIESYITGNNTSIHFLFHEIKEQIIEEFNQYQPSFVSQIEKKVNEVDFITSREFPELIHQENWDLIKELSPDLKTWLIYNKGKTVAYVWNRKKLSDSEARKKAELQLLLM